MKIGVQMFSTSEEINKFGVESVLKSLKEIGFSSVEMCTTFGNEFPEVQKKQKEMAEFYKTQMPSSVWSSADTQRYIDFAKKIGLEVTSIHAFALGGIPGIVEKCLPELISFAKKNGIKNYILSFLLHDIEGCKNVQKDIDYLVEELGKEEITVCYHNHEMEHIKLDADKSVLDYLLDICDNRLKIQLDTGWAVYGGENLKEAIMKYNKRIVSLHIKDIDENYKNMKRNEIFVAIGDGCVENKEVVNMLDFMDIIENGIIIDQDNSKIDLMTDLKKGYLYITK